MKYRFSWMMSLAAGVLAFSLASCASDFNESLENAQFHLDKGEYSKAVTEARGAVTADPTNRKAIFVLASALIAAAYIGDDENALDLLSRLFEDQAAGESGIETFARITPDLSTNDPRYDQLEEARDLLLSIPEASRDKDIYLQLYVARLFEISAATSRIGLLSPDDGCNADPSIPQADGIPDDYDPGALANLTDRNGESEAARFEDNLTEASSDAAKAGLPDDLSLNARLDRMAASLSAAADLAAFFDGELGNVGGVALCVP